MSEHAFELAPSGRSKCRGCSESISKDEVRFGERLPNPFGDGDMVHWHHPACAAMRRPEPLLEGLTHETAALVENPAELEAMARHQQSHRRLARLGTAEKASSGRARCRHCKALIEKDSWRLPLIFFEEGTYASSGFIHAQCAREYCDGAQVWPVVAHFARGFSDADRTALQESVADS